jgi:hypothetical protein
MRHGGVERCEMGTFALVLALLLSLLTGPAASAQPRRAPSPCVPGDACCPAAIGNFCRVGCPPPYPTPILRPQADVSALERPHPTGVAILEIAIDEGGRVVSACVVRSLRPDADNAAQRAAMRSTWTRKLLNGRPVGVVMTVTYEFPPPPAWSQPAVTPRSKLPLANGPVAYVDPTKKCPARPDWPLRVGSSLMSPPLLDYVEPHAPSPGVTRTVIVEVVVDPDGTVSRVKPLREAAGLTDLVVEAVGQWRYARACLNGQPIPVIVTAALRYGTADMR